MRDQDPKKGGIISASPSCQSESILNFPSKSNAMEELYRDHWRDLCRYLTVTFGPGPPEPEDVAQLAFTRIAAHKDFAGIRNLKSFLWTTAHNIVLSEKRSQAIRLRQSRNSGETFFRTKGDDCTPERVLLAKEQIDAVKATLAVMPAKRRRFFVLNRIEGLSFAEIARRTGVSQTAVKKHVARAMIDIDTAVTED